MRLFFNISLAVACSLIIAGCGSNDQSNETDAKDTDIKDINYDSSSDDSTVRPDEDSSTSETPLGEDIPPDTPDDNPVPSDPCDPNPCTQLNRTTCVATGDTYECNCDHNFILVKDQCVPDNEPGPCSPNPCTETNKTRCLLDGQGGYTCNCDYDYHDDNGLCCQAFAENVGGECKCREGYIDADNDGKCTVICSEDSIEGFNGWCPDGQICVQGTCATDFCADKECPENSECVNKPDSAFCMCFEGLHMSDGICCPQNAQNVNGTCQCNAGYELRGGNCVALPSNPCEPQNPCKSLHRTTCVPDDSAQGYSCHCSAGFEDRDGVCEMLVLESCPSGLQCRAGYCVPFDLRNDQCVTDDDCHEFSPIAPTTCNASAAGGICLNCTAPSDCPGNSQCTQYGTCANMCDDDDDCPYGKCSTQTGYCVQKYCSSDEDCFNGTACLNTGDSGRGMCKRMPCTETECSETFPKGTCPNPGEACVYGECLSSCTPNPCTKELNKNTCSMDDGAPVCKCNDGFAPDANGMCKLTPTTCPSSFSCTNGVCADKSDPFFVCQTNSDCGPGLTCSPNLPSGSCHGCSVSSPCPSGLTCMSGYCLVPCSLHDQCGPAMQCRGTGFCGRKPCTQQSDCADPYICVEGSDGGTCQRPICE
ncbi:MAG TPA: hypothetical protein PLC97_00530 [Myxococcota bacterium]|jgi:hypothetical protein|nr:hypothetical protein [Myxococcota bacterium]